MVDSNVIDVIKVVYKNAGSVAVWVNNIST